MYWTQLSRFGALPYGTLDPWPYFIIIIMKTNKRKAAQWLRKVFIKVSGELAEQFNVAGQRRVRRVVQCCFTFTETIITVRDGEPRTATSTFTQHRSSVSSLSDWILAHNMLHILQVTVWVSTASCHSPPWTWTTTNLSTPVVLSISKLPGGSMIATTPVSTGSTSSTVPRRMERASTGTAGSSTHSTRWNPLKWRSDPCREDHSSGAVWESRWPSSAVRPNEPSGFLGRKAILNSACP